MIFLSHRLRVLWKSYEMYPQPTRNLLSVYHQQENIFENSLAAWPNDFQWLQ